MNYYLSIDIGASSGRHILGSIQNGKLVLEEIYRFENGFNEKNGSLVWYIENLEKQVKTGIKKCAEINKIPVSVAIDTWGVDYVLLDENENLIGDAFSYRDKRTNDVIPKLEKDFSFEELYKKTGIQKQFFNTVYQLYCDSLSGKADKAKHFMMIPDYLHYTLTDVIHNEYTNATTGALVNAKANAWDKDILKAINIQDDIFKPLSLPTEFVGEFSSSMQDFCGFNAKVIHAPSHDTASAVAACPLDEKSLYISSGTWSLIGTEIQEPILSNESMNANFTNEGGIEYRFRYLKNYMGMWLFQNIRKNLQKKYTYDEMMQMAITSNFVDFFDVNDDSLVSPENMITAVNNLLEKPGLQIKDTLNAVYHSLAKSYKFAVDEIERLTGKSIDNIFIIGGGSKDKYLNKLTAEYTCKKVSVGLSEATATGNLIAQIMADKKINLNEARQLVLNSFNITEV